MHRSWGLTEEVLDEASVDCRRRQIAKRNDGCTDLPTTEILHGRNDPVGGILGRGRHLTTNFAHRKSIGI